MAKRFIDIIVSSFGIALLTPLILFLYILIRSRLGTPVLFTQERPGLSGKIFKLFKFRTMTNLTDSTGQLLCDDVRLTSLGIFMRKTSLDELPSLWNVLKGEMSLVGPRPLLVDYLDHYTSFQARRHDVKPGITGWAQINGRNVISWEEKFDLDIWYVDNQSLFLDVKILCLTMLKVIRQSDITSNTSVTMERFGRKS